MNPGCGDLPTAIAREPIIPLPQCLRHRPRAGRTRVADGSATLLRWHSRPLRRHDGTPGESIVFLCRIAGHGLWEIHVQAASPTVTSAADPLVARAREAALRAYAPYSRFSVGCAIESVEGEIVVGANMENACYRLGVCAEISALAAAQQSFGLDKVARIAVAGGHVEAGALAGQSVVTPCGGCRQAIYEAACLSGLDIEVISANGDGSAIDTRRIKDLLPSGFGPANLEDAG